MVALSRRHLAPAAVSRRPSREGAAGSALARGRTARLAAAVAAGALALAGLVAPTALATGATAPAVLDGAWAATWGVAPSNVSNAPDCQPCTIRNTVHTSIGGGRLRVTMSNAMGNDPVTIYTTTVSLPDSHDSSKAQPGTVVPVAFDGQASVTIPAGGYATSDAVDFTVAPDSDVQVTTFTQGAVTYHSLGTRPSTYIWRSTEDLSGQADPGTPASTQQAIFLVSGMDVEPAAGEPAPAGSVVVFGDSITDGVGSQNDADERWANKLARRLGTLPATLRMGVANAAISGNRILLDGSSTSNPAGVTRFQRDVIDRTGVRSVIVFEGINDLQQSPPQQDPQKIIDALRGMADKARAAGIRPIGATIAPWGGWGTYTDQLETVRQTVNTWIRTTDSYDAVVDFDAVLDDPANPGHMRTDYDSGDHLHPGPAGYEAMADAIDLAELGGYGRPGTVELSVPRTVARNTDDTVIAARVTTAQATQHARVTLTAPEGWTVGSPTTVDLGAMAAGSSRTVTWVTRTSTVAGRTSVHTLVTADLDGRQTSASAQTSTVAPSSTPDTTPPSVSITMQPGAPTSTGWFTSPVTFAVEADDTDANLWVQQQVDGASWETYVAPTTLADGVHTVAAMASDSSHNQSATATSTVRIDTTAPTVGATTDATARTVTLRATDATSGVARAEYRIGLGAWSAYTAPVSVGKAATVVTYRATDKAGNVSPETTTTVPAAAVTPPAGPTTPTGPSTPTKPGKVRAKVTLKVPAKTKRTKKIKGTVVVKAAARATGKVTVVLTKGKKTVSRKNVRLRAKAKKSTAKIALPATGRKGTYRIKAVYHGSSWPPRSRTPGASSPGSPSSVPRSPTASRSRAPGGCASATAARGAPST